MKILYAADNRIGSRFQLKRFIESIKYKNIDLRIAAYKRSLGDINADYMLDSLLNITNPEEISHNGNFYYYSKEIQRYAPDLIISDLEIYTSIIALDLNINLWQFSPNNLYYALPYNILYKLKIHKNYFHLVDGYHKKSNFFKNIINNSSRKFVLSHLADTEHNNLLSASFEWARPNFVLGDGNKKNNRLIVLPKFNKNLVDKLNNDDSVMVSFFKHDNFTGIKNINTIEYFKYLDNCNCLITDGTAVFLADAFYNQKYCISVPRYDDIETILGSILNKYCGLGCLLNDNIEYSNIDIRINDKVKFISEYLEEI